VGPLAAYFDPAIRAGKVPPMLIVFPNGLPNGMWCDSKDGRTLMETMLVKELIPHIDVTFRTPAARDGRIIEGFSVGGYGAARLGRKYHEASARGELDQPRDTHGHERQWEMAGPFRERPSFVARPENFLGDFLYDWESGPARPACPPPTPSANSRLKPSPCNLWLYLGQIRYEIVLARKAAKSYRPLPAYQRVKVRDALERHLRHEPTRVSKSLVKRPRGLSQPLYRLRVGGGASLP
jgi:hypothetical protein